MEYKDIFAMDSLDLIDFLTSNFLEDIPVQISTIEEMNHASSLLLKLTSNYSYLCALLSFAKVITRQAKRELTKSDFEDLIDKKDIINNITSAVKQQYSAVSRAITVHIENNAELRMNATGGR